MMTESESDVTSSMDSSSPPHVQFYADDHPPYVVQSPARDSIKSTFSSHKSSPPPAYTPIDSPTYSSSGYGRSSTESSPAQSRVSGKFRWSNGSESAPLRRGGFALKRSDCDVINEEEEYDDDDAGYDHHVDEESAATMQCRALIVIIGLFVAFTVSCFVVWGYGRPFKPEISVQSLTVHNFNIWDGSDLTGVPTKFLTINSSLEMVIYNPATFFGIHVSSAPVELLYATLRIATGQIEQYYQPKKRHYRLAIKLEGKKVLLYGAGPSLARSDHYGGIPVHVTFEIQAQGNMIGKLVKSKHRSHTSCSLVINSQSNQAITITKDSCVSLSNILLRIFLYLFLNIFSLVTNLILPVCGYKYV